MTDTSATSGSPAGKPLAGKVAVVTGSSRGIGRGAAVALGQLGATVYVTGRTTGDGELTIDRTVALVDAAGGRGIAVRTDHGVDAEIEALFAQVAADEGRLDILVNNVYKIPDPPAWGGGFWQHPISIWDDQVGIGLRAHSSRRGTPPRCCCRRALAGSSATCRRRAARRTTSVRPTAPARRGSIDSTRTWPSSSSRKGSPGSRCTPAACRPSSSWSRPASRDTDIEGAQTPLVVGRCIAALAIAPDLMERSGSIQWVEDVGAEFGIVDEHGRPPAPYRASRRVTERP